MSSEFGKNIKFSVFGQSHSSVIGCEIDTLPAGIEINTSVLEQFMSRRAPGTTPYSTARKEADKPEFLCGFLPHKSNPDIIVTCGAPLVAVIRNNDARSADYELLTDVFRPSHADYTANIAYNGFQDMRGGGHFSGRLTAPLCIAGGICKQLLADKGMFIGAHISSVGSIKDLPFDAVGLSRRQLEQPGSRTFPVLDDAQGALMKKLIEDCKNEGDSIGGTVECAVIGLPAGIGLPMFDGIENRLCAALFGIPAMKGIEFGSGFAGSELRASQNNDEYRIENGSVTTATNNHGGILGGISSGLPLIFKCAYKPTPSVSREQKSVSKSRMCELTLKIPGRHDPCIVPRAVAVTEAVAACVICDLLFDSPKH